MKNDRHDVFNKRSENARSLKKMIENTKENIEEAEVSMEFAAPEELENLKDKNAHRRTSIAQMEEQMKEYRARKKY